ncbi:MAG: S49 family peptidase, partial [Thermoanaerobaculia bacterium]|nr:S49 family peptidase [Thermoanaerobaculia bacterium]
MADASSKNARTCLIVAAVLLVLMMVPVVLFWLFVRSLEVDEVKIAGGSILEIDFADVFGDGPTSVDLGPFLTTGLISLWELDRAIDAAAEDEDIAGIQLQIRGSAIGWAGAEEILARLDQFRAGGKPVHALIDADMVDDHDYFLATGADRIWITPAAASVINGLAAEAQFMRGTLEKLHIEPQVIMYKEYKSAGEQFGNYEMSPYMRESLAAVLATTQARFEARLEARRGLDPATVRDFLGRGMAPAGALLESGLVDELGYVDEVRAALAAAAGADEYRGVSASRYLSRLRGSAPRRPQIALIFGEGPVVTTAP